MERYIGLESKFARIMTRVADLVILNIIFLISCIPIITIGSAITALYSVTLKMCRNEEAYIIRGYLKAFKEVFIITTVEWLVVLFTGGMLYLDIRMFEFISEKWAKIGLISVIILWGLIVTYIFPVAAQFKKSALKTFQISILLAVRHVGYSVLALTGGLVPVFCIRQGRNIAMYCIVTFLLIGFSTIALMYSYVYRKIFAQYE